MERSFLSIVSGQSVGKEGDGFHTPPPGSFRPTTRNPDNFGVASSVRHQPLKTSQRPSDDFSKGNLQGKAPKTSVGRRPTENLGVTTPVEQEPPTTSYTPTDKLPGGDTQEILQRDVRHAPSESVGVRGRRVRDLPDTGGAVAGDVPSRALFNNPPHLRGWRAPAQPLTAWKAMRSMGWTSELLFLNLPK